MPKTTKEVKIDNEKDDIIKTKKSTTATKKTNVKKTENKAVAKKTATATKKSTSSTVKKDSATIEKKKATKKSNSAEKNTTTTKKTPSTTAKKAKTSATKKKTASKVKKIDSNIVAEYYDLPYRYNETIVKILYQTPTILFVYWDISDSDRENFIKEYGENFFNNTRPILRIFNLTKNYSFEVEINDFANSWYITVNDANCEYKVELARKTIKYEENLKTDYIRISSSNNIEFPNDHILLDQLPDVIRFKNVQTNKVSTKNVSTLHLVGVNKIYNVHDFYKNFYKDEILEEQIINTSSSWN